MNFIKLFSKPRPIDLAKNALVDAELSLLNHQAASEYHTGMISAYNNQIRRLTQYTQALETRNTTGGND